MSNPVPVPTLTVFPPSSETESRSRSPSPLPPRPPRPHRSRQRRTGAQENPPEPQPQDQNPSQWLRSRGRSLSPKVLKRKDRVKEVRGPDGVHGQGGRFSPLLLPPSRSRWSLRSLISRDSDWDSSCRSVRPKIYK
ncbi:serine/arginine repetitive matrix protein 1-like [Astyanax mexicanus]|uniref:serine/arginine repetitive matrix protein 1-like n=1 Tax=Astyanax mexicanus TaxID=7994 RepID=UPI0020CB0888|nr:serine/arginine repetitive matrix protein 1-like [Astyanax mexicanus]